MMLHSLVLYYHSEVTLSSYRVYDPDLYMAIMQLSNVVIGLHSLANY